LAADGHNDRFEIDPRLRLRLQKELRPGPEAVIGVFHSHPDGPAQPSDTDLENAWEPELIWLITAVVAGQATQTTAHRLVDQASRFEQLAVRTTDWHADSTRAPVELPPGLSASRQGQNS
jgi:proteasome lid subunit RPN8/RPN11